MNRIATDRLPDSGRFVALDSWRGLAALGVMLSHLHESLPSVTWLGNGWIFVDFFFVLSGFVIAGGYWERLAEGFPVRRFMLLRIGRLYPLHAFVLALFVVRELLQGALYARGIVLREPFSGSYDLTHLLMVATLTQALPPVTELSWSGPSWSISVELWLYLAFGLLFALPRRFVLAVALGFVAWGAYSLGPWTDDPAPWFNTLLQRGFFAFGAGVVCWRLWISRIRGWALANSSTGATVLEVLAVGAVGYALVAGGAPYRLVLAVPLFAALVLLFAAERGAVSRLLRLTPFVTLGVLSYSIYLLHVLVIGTGIAAARLAGLVALEPQLGPPAHTADSCPIAVAFYLAAVGITLALAYFTWRFIEWPGIQWSRRVAARFGVARAERNSPTF